MVSVARPNVFILKARSMSLNSADAGFSIFAATEALAFSRTGSGVSTGLRPDAETLILVGWTASLASATRLCGL